MAQPVCVTCGVALDPLTMLPEGRCRQCRARRHGAQTAGAYLEPIPYGKVCLVCFGCGGPALLAVVEGLAQPLPATVIVHYRCVLCGLVEANHVHITACWELTGVGTHYVASP